MGSDWMDEVTDGDILFPDESHVGFYCPYTNGPECALGSNSSQPQDLCEILECEQLKFHLRRSMRKRPN